MYSEALRELDHNTEVYMVEEERRKVTDLTKELVNTKQKLDEAESKMALYQSILRQNNISLDN